MMLERKDKVLLQRKKSQIEESTKNSHTHKLVFEEKGGYHKRILPLQNVCSGEIEHEGLAE